MKIDTKDEIVLAVLKKMDQRSIIGQEKYGATMMQEIEGQEKDLNRFLIDVQEELMDALLYIEAAKRCLSDEIEQAMINRNNIIGQNGNDGLHYDKDLALDPYDEEHALDVVLNDMVKDIEVNEETTL
jgi:hypothetical protein